MTAEQRTSRTPTSTPRRPRTLHYVFNDDWHDGGYRAACGQEVPPKQNRGKVGASSPGVMCTACVQVVAQYEAAMDAFDSTGGMP